jgi:hypothetical protein
VSSTLPERVSALATAIVEEDRTLASWYEVEFASTSNEAQPTIEVVLVRPGIKARLSAVRRLP